jgi:hypothetical protein
MKHLILQFPLNCYRPLLGYEYSPQHPVKQPPDTETKKPQLKSQFCKLQWFLDRWREDTILN